VNEKPRNALIIQCIGTQHSPTCFGTLKCHHQGVKHDPAEIGAQFRGKQWRSEGGFWGFPPPRNSKVLTKLSRIPSSVKIHPYQPNQNMGFTHLQIGWNP
jgi:hypothetical protein